MHLWLQILMRTCLLLLPISVALAAPMAGCDMANQLSGDWMATAGAGAMPIRPANCSVSDQTPPDFSWPGVRRNKKYLVELRFPDGHVVNRQAERNWLLWGETLPPGSYAWRVSMFSGDEAPPNPSVWREFAIQEDAVPFVVPNASELFRRAATKVHPRAFPIDETKWRLLEALNTERHAAWDHLLQRLDDGQRGSGVSNLPVWLTRAEGNKAYAMALGEAKRDAAKDFERLLESAFAFMVTGNEQYKDQALGLLRFISQWSTTGASGVSQHQVAGRYTWTLALAYDWLYPYLSQDDRRRVIDAIGARINALLAEFSIPDGKLDRMPFNSHGWVALGEMAAASALLAGDDEQTHAWFDDTVQPFLQSITPWAGHEGGMANGTGYGVWDLTALMLPMDILGYCLDMDVYAKAPLRNMPDFLAQFIPPGSPTGVFGDAAEIEPGMYVGGYARALALRVPSPVANWYAKQVETRKYSLMHVFAPVLAGGGSGAAQPPSQNGMYAPTSGWVAMHSNINDPNRTSIYFKSSPYGSFNHSHADQNSFEVVSKGKPVLIDSGYYDFFKSQHWSDWYKLTRAHNAITFDGGQGQVVNERSASGTVLSYVASSTLDVAVGNATQAYGGALGKAIRTLAYVRPDTLIVVDQLASASPKIWEWNLHALEPFVQLGADTVTVQYGSEKACVSVFSRDGSEFSQFQGFPVQPDPKWGKERQAATQWHGVFKSRTETRKWTQVAMIELGCHTPSRLQVRDVGGRTLVEVGSLKLAVDERGSVEALSH